MNLTRRTPSSFYCDNLVELVRHLIDNGYSLVAPRSDHEYARLACEKSLIVMYHSGSVLVQGQHRDGAIGLLETVGVPF